MKLYHIDLGYPLGEFYVVGKDPTDAYEKLRAILDNNDYGLAKDRELGQITQLASVGIITDHGGRLIL